MRTSRSWVALAGVMFGTTASGDAIAAKGQRLPRPEKQTPHLLHSHRASHPPPSAVDHLTPREREELLRRLREAFNLPPPFGHEWDREEQQRRALTEIRRALAPPTDGGSRKLEGLPQPGPGERSSLRGIAPPPRGPFVDCEVVAAPPSRGGAGSKAGPPAARDVRECLGRVGFRAPVDEDTGSILARYRGFHGVAETNGFDSLVGSWLATDLQLERQVRLYTVASQVGADATLLGNACRVCRGFARDGPTAYMLIERTEKNESELWIFDEEVRERVSGAGADQRFRAAQTKAQGQ